MPALSLKSERGLQSDFLSVLISELNLNDINPGSVLDVISQAASQSDFNVLFQVAQISRLNDIQFLTRGDLDLKAFEYGLTRFVSQPATGLISILRPTGFVKVSTTFSPQTTPIAGATTIDVNDASNALIGSAGTLILGRGTNNEETVTYSVAPANNVSFWTFVLDAPLTFTHATEETVILSQGSDELLLAGTIVRVLANGVQPEIQFSLDDDATLLTGEDVLLNVGVTAIDAGALGNIPSGSITGTLSFSTPPFVGARAENNSKFTTGRDLETDDDLRDRIRTAGDSLTRGVKQAILNAIVGLVDPDSAKRVVSSNVVLPVDECGDVKVYIDDGTGFEPSFAAQGFEVIREVATGGESRFQLDQFPVQKATIENTTSETYDFSAGGEVLNYQVGILQESVTFNASDFASPGIATAEEIITAINDKATLIEARTSQVGRQVIINAVEDINEDIQVLGGTANTILLFPTDRVDTLNLYRDDQKLSKDGLNAALDSQNSSPFDLSTIGAFPHTLTVVVDGKTANTQTATVVLADVVDGSSVTLAEIITVINRDLAGLTASAIDSNSRVRLTSNSGLSTSSRIQVTGGTLNDAVNGLNFSTTEIIGRNADYVFNRELGIVELTTPLTANQSLTGGSLFTRGKLRAVLPELYVAVLGQTLVVSVDGGADQTVTFDGSFAAGQSAAVTAAFISAQLNGAEAIVRLIGTTNFVEIRTNTFAVSGSVEIQPTSTANAAGFQFPENVAAVSDPPDTAFRVSGSVGPYAFAEGDVLTVVVDGNIAQNTFSTVLSRAATVTTSTSTTVFGDAAIPNTFLTADEIADFFVAFTSGANTTSETITDVVDQGGGVFRLTFNAVPANFGDYVVGDLINVTGLADAENNGAFVIQALGVQTVDVLDPNGVNASGQTGTGVLSQKRIVGSYNQLTGEVSVSVGFANVPAVTDTCIFMPRTVGNVVSYLSNIRVTPMSLKAVTEGVDNNTRVQISSLSFGSDGVIEIPGTSGNEKLNFSTVEYRGVATYRYWTGLLRRVHSVIYGVDTNLVEFPGVGAAGITFRVLAPTVREIRVELDVTLDDGISVSTLENEVRSVVAAYINSSGVGEDVILEQVRANVIGVSGILDVSVSNPTGNVVAADNEVVRVSDSNIIVG